MSRLPPWVPAIEACFASASRPLVFTYCSVSKQGRPTARSCVARGWLFGEKSTGVIVFTTDKRSSKIINKRENDETFEACFYFPEQGMQFRLSGFTQQITKNSYPTLKEQFCSLVTSKKNISTTSSSSSSLSSGMTTPSPTSVQQPIEEFPAHLATPPNVPGWEENTSTPTNTVCETSKTDTLPLQTYPVYSPEWLKHNDIYSAYPYVPPAPTPEEWAGEYARVWSLMRSSMKSSFKRPTPGAKLTDARAHLIDKIARGVDGSSDEQGMDNMIVMAMFTDSVDVLMDKSGRRIQYSRVEGDEWMETEICP